MRLPSTPRLMVGPDEEPRYVYDLKARKDPKEKIDVSSLPIYRKRSAHGWGAIPGTDQFFLVAKNEAGTDYWLGKHELDGDGTPVPVGQVKKLKLGEETVFSTPTYGSGILATNWKRADYIDPVTLEARPLVKFKASQKESISGQAVLTADGKSALILVDPADNGRNRTEKTTMYVLRVDVATGEEQGRTPLGEDTELHALTALPDGSFLVVGDNDVKKILFPF